MGISKLTVTATEIPHMKLDAPRSCVKKRKTSPSTSDVHAPMTKSIRKKTSDSHLSTHTIMAVRFKTSPIPINPRHVRCASTVTQSLWASVHGRSSRAGHGPAPSAFMLAVSVLVPALPALLLSSTQHVSVMERHDCDATSAAPAAKVLVLDAAD